MPKSLLITNLFPPDIGGVQKLLHEIANQLPPTETVVLAPAHSSDDEFDAQHQFNIYRQTEFPPGWRGSIYKIIARFLPPILVRIVLYFPTAFSLIKRKNIEIVQVGFLHVGLVAYLLKKLTGKPYILYVYGDEILPRVGWKKYSFELLIRMILKNSDAIVTISEYTRQQVIQRQVDERKIVKIPLGANLANFTTPPQIEGIINKLNLEDKKVILTVGRLVEHKGHDMVVKALPSVLKRIPNVVYLIIGCGPAEKWLRELVNELSLQNHVILLGYIPDEQLPSYYHLCDLFIMLSRSLADKRRVEGFGLVYLEANAWGKPVIGGCSGGVPDAVLDGITGLLVDPTNISEIAETMIKILSNPAYAQFLGMNGRRRVEAEMNWPQAGIKVYQVLTAIIEGKYI